MPVVAAWRGDTHFLYFSHALSLYTSFSLCPSLFFTSPLSPYSLLFLPFFTSLRHLFLFHFPFFLWLFSFFTRFPFFVFLPPSSLFASLYSCCRLFTTSFNSLFSCFFLSRFSSFITFHFLLPFLLKVYFHFLSRFLPFFFAFFISSCPSSLVHSN